MESRFGKARRGQETRPGRRLLATLIVGVTAGSLTTVATPASAATKWLQVSASFNFTCGVTTSHDLWCWGINVEGQLGTGDTENRPAPTRIGKKGIWASVSTGFSHTCALDRDGIRYCWGFNEFGQLGYDDRKNRFTPTPAESATWTMVSAGAYHGCGIQTNRRAYCWGDDWHGQVGNSTARSDGGPSVKRVQFDGRWSAVGARYNSTCGLDSEGTRYCWGFNESGALGLGKRDEYIPIPTTWGNGTWRSVEAGLRTGCGISKGRRLYCWGENENGQVGVGDTEDRPEPTQVSGKDWAQVSMGAHHTCGIKTDGIGYCWGSNKYGELGIGTPLISNRTVPGVIDDILGNIPRPGHPNEPPMTWSSISAGVGHTCGIRTDGILFCWGDNKYGQLGQGVAGGKSFSPLEVV